MRITSTWSYKISLMLHLKFKPLFSLCKKGLPQWSSYGGENIRTTNLIHVQNFQHSSISLIRLYMSNNKRKLSAENECKKYGVHKNDAKIFRCENFKNHAWILTSSKTHDRVVGSGTIWRSETRSQKRSR